MASGLRPNRSAVCSNWAARPRARALRAAALAGTGKAGGARRISPAVYAQACARGTKATRWSAGSLGLRNDDQVAREGPVDLRDQLLEIRARALAGQLVREQAQLVAQLPRPVGQTGEAELDRRERDRQPTADAEIDGLD